ncbi:MAG: hypothetical protein IT552_12395 [Sphingomonadaceae bacterium]|nr:hypothetical protein [Sphingomonadaceae bacterium]
MTDYCTAFPDGWPTWLGGTGSDWAHCCKAHDQFYASYDGWLGYFGAHWDLATCVAQAGFAPIGAVMFAGLSTVGTLFVINRKNRVGRRG